MDDFIKARKRIEVSTGESVKIIRELQGKIFQEETMSRLLPFFLILFFAFEGCRTGSGQSAAPYAHCPVLQCQWTV